MSSLSMATLKEIGIQNTSMPKLNFLGLGMGIDATNPQIWKHKSSLAIREISLDLNNITETKLGGEKEYFQQIVPTWGLCQKEIIAAMEDPERSLNFGTHLEFSDSFDRIIVTQRFLSSTFAFSDTPVGSSEFEMKLCSFIYKQFCPQSEDQHSTVQRSPVSVLTDYISTLKRAGNTSYLQEIGKACHEYIATSGVTHYISGVQLGAVRYNTYSYSQYIEILGDDIGPMGGPLTPGAITTAGAKWMLDMFNFSSVAGRMGRGEDVEDVIGFDIQPVYTLVKQQDIREYLQRAVMEYIESKPTDERCGYMIATSVTDNSKEVYWTVDGEGQVMGTERKEDASIFHIQPAGTIHSPSEFLIRYDKQTKGQGTVYSFLRYNGNLLGWTSEPLKVTSGMGDRFLVHGQNTIPYLCTSITKTLQDWAEGQELYLKSSRDSMFKLNGFVGMRPLEISQIQNETHCTHGVSPFHKEEKNTRFHLISVEKSDWPKARRFQHSREITAKEEQSTKEIKQEKKMDISVELLTPESPQPVPRKRAVTVGAATNGEKRPENRHAGLSLTSIREEPDLKQHQKRISEHPTTQKEVETEERVPQRRSRSKTVSSTNRDDFKRSTQGRGPRARPRSSSTSGASEPRRVRFIEQEGGPKQAAQRARSKTVSAGSRENGEQRRSKEV